MSPAPLRVKLLGLEEKDGLERKFSGTITELLQYGQRMIGSLP
jgi:hypothetical protein